MVEEACQIQPLVHRGANSSVSLPDHLSDRALIRNYIDRDDVLGHAKIRQGLKGHMGVATGEHAHNRYVHLYCCSAELIEPISRRMTFKQLLQAQAIDVCQIDSVRISILRSVACADFMP